MTLAAHLSGPRLAVDQRVAPAASGGAVASLLLTVQPLGSVLLGVAIFSESPTSLQLAGAGTILAGLMAVARSRVRTLGGCPSSRGRAGPPDHRAPRARPADRRRRRPRHLRLPPARARRARPTPSRARRSPRPTGAGSPCGSTPTAGLCSGCTSEWPGASSSTSPRRPTAGTASASSSPTAGASRCATSAGWAVPYSIPTSARSARTPRGSPVTRSASGLAAARPRSRPGSWTNRRWPASATCSPTRSCGARSSTRGVRPAPSPTTSSTICAAICGRPRGIADRQRRRAHRDRSSRPAATTPCALVAAGRCDVPRSVDAPLGGVGRAAGLTAALPRSHFPRSLSAAGRMGRLPATSSRVNDRAPRALGHAQPPGDAARCPCHGPASTSRAPLARSRCSCSRVRRSRTADGSSSPPRSESSGPCSACGSWTLAGSRLAVSYVSTAGGLVILARRLVRHERHDRPGADVGLVHRGLQRLLLPVARRGDLHRRLLRCELLAARHPPGRPRRGPRDAHRRGRAHDRGRRRWVHRDGTRPPRRASARKPTSSGVRTSASPTSSPRCGASRPRSPPGLRRLRSSRSSRPRSPGSSAPTRPPSRRSFPATRRWSWVAGAARGRFALDPGALVPIGNADVVRKLSDSKRPDPHDLAGPADALGLRAARHRADPRRRDALGRAVGHDDATPTALRAEADDRLRDFAALAGPPSATPRTARGSRRWQQSTR